MKTFVVQVYIEAGISFPFSHHWQRWIHIKLSELIHDWGASSSNYNDEFDLVFNLSSKHDIIETEIRGPSIYKRGKAVEYTLFIPFKLVRYSEFEKYRDVLICIFQSIVSVLEKLGIESKDVEANIDEMVEFSLNTPEFMVSGDGS